ncbi:MAG: hypothetical protein MJZ97_04060 [Bacteroidales bacterium]|nr:hypothetical protein [Bacteroidales bacterium]
MKRNIKSLLFSAALLLCCLTAGAVGTQPSAGDGSQANPYQIATSDNLVWFAEHVNSGNTSACAKLTADITVNANVLDSDGNLNGTPSNTWTPIGGQYGNDYSGEFDGDGHTISGLYFNDGTSNNIGLFGKTANNAYIHDLGVSDSYFCGNSWVAGICGNFASGRIENCWNGATVIANSSQSGWSCAGGIAASCWTDASVRGCYNIGKVSVESSDKSQCGGICGTVAKNTNVDYSVSNCVSLEGKCDMAYNLYNADAVVENVVTRNGDAFESGEVCYLLNSGVTDGSQKWFQTLGGTDNLPVLDNSHGTVYYGYDGDVLTYSNSPLTPPSIDNVAYIDANGEPQTADNVFIIMNASEQVTWSAGWYVVQGADITLAKGAVCNGAVHLILADGAKLTATGNDDNKTPGIQVSGDGNSLAVYGQSAQSGQLEAVGGNWAAGIGGGWHANYFGNGSNITINGGIVTATGGQSGAGIGGGQGGNGTHITINGGNVTATGGQNAAGIGGGLAGTTGGLGSYITITGGKVTANGGSGASGIGGSGLESSSSNIIIAATLLVKADDFNNPPTTVIPNTGSDLAGSLNGKQYVTTEPIIITYGEYITVSPEFESGDNVAYGTYTFTAADRWADNYEFLGFYKESTFNTPITEGVSGYVYTLTVNEAAISVYAKYRQHFNVPYIDADGQEQTTDAVEIANNTLNAGWYVVRGSDENHGQLTCNGAVHIILADGAKLTANGWYEVPGITVSGEGNSLTIYGQTNQSGQLIAQGGHQGAGIGGGVNGSGSNITINGGTVTAKGGEYAAGIGGGLALTSGGLGSYITINGGTVTASGGNYAAGIGGGSNASGSNITINGGTVTANGGGNAAGIGGGSNASGSNITINGGKVTATGGVGGAGVGGGFAGSGSNITINGGTVTANAGENASCIGRGNLWHGNYGSNIFVAVELVVRADNSNPPQTVVAADRTAETDIAGDLDGKRYATVRIPQPCIVTYGDYITVSPQFASGGTVAVGTEITFTAADRFADNYEFLGFYKESTFENKITNGVSGLTYTATVLDDDISVYAKYEEFIPTPYIDANGQEQSVKTTEITNETSTLNAGWYVVTGEVSRGNITCNGAVHLILADGAKLTATGGNNQAGITVSGGGNSLTIYGQTAQSGQLFATGGYEGAGIGGGKYGSGSNITVNGGTVTANGGDSGAGIGGGWHGSGSNIIINGGNVIANGGGDVYGGAGIGGGYEGSGWSIKVATALTVYADNTNPPTTEISHTDNDIASHIAVFRYVIVNDVATGAKEAAIAAINAAIEGVTNADIIAIATNAIDAINAATSADVINAIKEQALAAIASAKAIYNSALGEMGEPCEDCPAVEVTKGDNTIILYNPESVTFKKTE